MAEIAIDQEVPMPLLPPTSENLEACAQRLRDGELVAFPTETVYGLGANALDAAAVRKIYQAKGRPSHNPLIVHVADVEQAKALVQEWPERAQLLADQYWPGPLTMVLRKQPHLPEELSAGLSTVAIRIPNHPITLDLLRRAGVPVAAPSANRSTEVSPTRPQHVLQSLGEDVWVLDGGATEVGIESTVVDLTGDQPVLLRPGGLARTGLQEEIGELAEPSLTEEDAPRPSPGMLERHYAPKAKVHLFSNLTDAHFHAVMFGSSRKVGVIAFSPAKLNADEIILPNDAVLYAREIYSALRELDDRGCGLILIEDVPATPDWEAVRDRLSRAAKSTAG
jgi:L-threonylcarbamoyladenylate synthase